MQSLIPVWRDPRPDNELDPWLCPVQSGRDYGRCFTDTRGNRCGLEWDQLVGSHRAVPDAGKFVGRGSTSGKTLYDIEALR